MVFRFGDCEIDAGRYELRRAGQPVAVEPRALDLLLYLVRARERLVTKQELLDAVWEGAHVGESALTRAVSLARAAIGDSGQEHRVIETVAGRGYRFEAPVEIVDAPGPDAARERSATRRAVVAALGVVLTFGLALALLWPRPLGWVLVLAGSAVPPVLPPLPSQPSVVVLPFVDLSPGAGYAHLAAGIADDLSGELGRFSELFVISRSSAFTYAGKNVDVRVVGRELGVRYVVEGSVRVAAQHGAVSARLVDASTGVQLFGDRLEAPLDELLGAEATLAERIVGALGARITDAELARLRDRATDDLDAYEAFLRGREHFFAFTRDGHQHARELFQRAAELDPGYNLPIAYLGALEMSAYLLGWDPRPERVARAREFARRALALDPYEPMPHTTLAVADYVDGHLDDALAGAQTAVSLGPNSDACLGVQATVLARAERPIAALRALDRALRLNPRHPELYWMLAGFVHERAGRPDRAIELFERIREANPDMVPPRLALIVHRAADPERASELADEILRINPVLTADIALRLYAPAERDSALSARALEAFRSAGLP